ncbi:MAG: hypothetical protein JW940_10155 [Polyangiaceae bacterium]|nr:hypothetical protein [Polyangiaceae bacterium]
MTILLRRVATGQDTEYPTLEHLRIAAYNGHLQPTDLVWDQVHETWLPLVLALSHQPDRGGSDPAPSPAATRARPEPAACSAAVSPARSRRGPLLLVASVVLLAVAAGVFFALRAAGLLPASSTTPPPMTSQPVGDDPSWERGRSAMGTCAPLVPHQGSALTQAVYIEEVLVGPTCHSPACDYVRLYCDQFCPARHVLQCYLALWYTARTRPPPTTIGLALDNGSFFDADALGRFSDERFAASRGRDHQRLLFDSLVLAIAHRPEPGFDLHHHTGVRSRQAIEMYAACIPPGRAVVSVVGADDDLCDATLAFTTLLDVDRLAEFHRRVREILEARRAEHPRLNACDNRCGPRDDECYVLCVVGAE